MTARRHAYANENGACASRRRSYVSEAKVILKAARVAPSCGARRARRLLRVATRLR
jgi:hypothetical protein